MRSDPRLAEAMRRILRQDQTAMTDGLVHHAACRLAPGAAPLFAEVAPAVILHRVVVVGEPCDAAFVAHLVDDVLLPLLSTPADPNHPHTQET